MPNAAKKGSKTIMEKILLITKKKSQESILPTASPAYLLPLAWSGFFAQNHLVKVTSGFPLIPFSDFPLPLSLTASLQHVG